MNNPVVSNIIKCIFIQEWVKRATSKLRYDALEYILEYHSPPIYESSRISFKIVQDYQYSYLLKLFLLCKKYSTIFKRPFPPIIIHQGYVAFKTIKIFYSFYYFLDGTVMCFSLRTVMPKIPIMNLSDSIVDGPSNTNSTRVLHSNGSYYL